MHCVVVPAIRGASREIVIVSESKHGCVENLLAAPTAPTPLIDGDIEEWRDLVKPKQDVRATGNVSCTVHTAAGARAFCEPAAGGRE